MGERGGALVWFRRDLRLADHPALAAAFEAGWAAPVFILDEELSRSGGAASRWRLSRSLRRLAADIEALGGRLIVRRGEALAELRKLIKETGARSVVWSRRYDAPSIERDQAVKAALKEDGVAARSFPGMLLVEPFAIETQDGGPYRVYSPFWKALAASLEPGAPLNAPTRWVGPETWPESLEISELGLEAAMNRGGAILEKHAPVGETAAQERLAVFLDEKIADYGRDRDRLDLDGTSRLSAHLAVGEISPRSAWHAAKVAIERAPGCEKGATVFLKELVWREFAWHLLHHAPDMGESNWREKWDGFPWRGDGEAAERWRRGRTGVRVVDAAMRELYVTGHMHNRARMLVASYLTKHLMTDWRVGEAWFRDCLVDWDPASNAMGWQWVAGSGPDAAPFFRIFNPETQAEKFDPDGAYVRRWLAEASEGDLVDGPSAEAMDFFAACPRSWGAGPEDPYPEPVISLAEGRKRALSAFETLSGAAS